MTDQQVDFFIRQFMELEVRLSHIAKVLMYVASSTAEVPVEDMKNLAFVAGMEIQQ